MLGGNIIYKESMRNIQGIHKEIYIRNKREYKEHIRKHIRNI